MSETLWFSRTCYFFVFMCTLPYNYCFNSYIVFAWHLELCRRFITGHERSDSKKSVLGPCASNGMDFVGCRRSGLLNSLNVSSNQALLYLTCISKAKSCHWCAYRVAVIFEIFFWCTVYEQILIKALDWNLLTVEMTRIISCVVHRALIR